MMHRPDTRQKRADRRLVVITALAASAYAILAASAILIAVKTDAATIPNSPTVRPVDALEDSLIHPTIRRCETTRRRANKRSASAGGSMPAPVVDALQDSLIHPTIKRCETTRH